jgi:hypothetical protein
MYKYYNVYINNLLFSSNGSEMKFLTLLEEHTLREPEKRHLVLWVDVANNRRK